MFAIVLWKKNIRMTPLSIYKIHILTVRRIYFYPDAEPLFWLQSPCHGCGSFWEKLEPSKLSYPKTTEVLNRSINLPETHVGIHLKFIWTRSVVQATSPSKEFVNRLRKIFVFMYIVASRLRCGGPSFLISWYIITIWC